MPGKTLAFTGGGFFLPSILGLLGVCEIKFQKYVIERHSISHLAPLTANPIISEM